MPLENKTTPAPSRTCLCRWTESCWRAPLLFAVLFWGGYGCFFLGLVYQYSVPWVDSLMRTCGDALMWGMIGVLLAGGILLPVVVALQLARRKWKTALATTLLSALTLFPLGIYLHAL